ncbi:hypothetical protein, partial [Cellulomonas citrea]|uniref:hypothetical protein n=1 Tax=Cellulomonas citrea TaxID=1909423 RepID=UPI001B356C2B
MVGQQLADQGLDQGGDPRVVLTGVPQSPTRRPSCTAPARACADSIAGMMPSVRHSDENASIASSSVT